MGKKFFVCFFLLLFVLLWVEVYDSLQFADHEVPPFVELESVAEKAELTEEDYRLIFLQTGLGKPAVDDFRKNDNFYQVLKMFQEQKMIPAYYERRYLFFPTTTADVLVDEEGRIRCLKLPPLEDGDIIITKSTKTLIYRHGHAALVTDGETKTTMEAMMLGTDSTYTSARSLGSYATLMILRPKSDDKSREAALEYARRNLLGVPYHLTAGFFDKDKTDDKHVDSTHCSHLVWQAYKAAGVDLDTDGGWLVSPCDISSSKNLEVVFSYGFGDDGKW